MAKSEGDVTREEVKQALESLFTKGVKPSAEKILQKTGRGSKTTIMRYRKELERTQQLSWQQPYVIDKSISEDLVRVLLGERHKNMEAARAESAERIETLQGQLDEMIDALEQREKELTAAQEAIAQLKEEQSVLMGKMAQVQEDAKLARDSLQAVVVDLAVARTHLQAKANIEEEFKLVRLELAKAQDALSKRQARR